MDYSQILSKTIQISQEAAKIILDIYSKDFCANIKEDKTFVTEADILADRKIKEMLLSSFPSMSVLSEESIDDKTRLNNDFCWIVDPLDGTKDYVNRTNEFSINLALSYKHKIVLSVINIPYKNLIYFAIKNRGSFKLENNCISKIHVSKRSNKLIMLRSHFFFSKEEENRFNSCPFVNKIIACGSAYKACQIAEGTADFCVKYSPNTKVWDIAASDLLIKEAGGILTDIYGEEITYNHDNVFNDKGFLITNSFKTLSKIISISTK